MTTTPSLFSINDMQHDVDSSNVNVMANFSWGQHIVETVNINSNGEELNKNVGIVELFIRFIKIFETIVIQWAFYLSLISCELDPNLRELNIFIFFFLLNHCHGIHLCQLIYSVFRLGRKQRVEYLKNRLSLPTFTSCRIKP